MLTGFLQRNRCSAIEVADLSQETFARIYESAQRERPLLVKAFLFQIARNLMIDHLRKQNVVPLETIAEFEWANLPDDKPSSERQAAARQELRLLQTALDDLPARCRQIVVMQRVDGLSQKEIAGQLGITVETVQTQLAKGMRLLAQAIGGRRSAVTTEARRHNFLRKLRDAR
ncbi:MAG TPA: RNA polymerase sigma factor [Rhizomicrobium sp.]|jgi:RNA polymerase sigma-70 factor (ECF subfamily)|nr:RNA polymerase sigma factor [Rhizomicrobium sp.]